MHDSKLIHGQSSTPKLYTRKELLKLSISPLSQGRPAGMPDIIGLTINPAITQSALAAIAQSQDGKPKQPRSHDRS